MSREGKTTRTRQCFHFCLGLFSLIVFTGGKVAGKIMVGGFPKEQRSFARIMGYCQQEDVHAPFVSYSCSVSRLSESNFNQMLTFKRC